MPDGAPYLSDFYVELSNLTDAATGLVVNDATVTISLWTKTGVAITNAQNLAAGYVAASNGKYRATVPKTAGVALGGIYRGECKIVKGGLEFHMWLKDDLIIERFPA